MLKKLISPASIVTVIIALGLFNIGYRSVVCHPNVDNLVDRCTVSTFGNYIFPHPVLFEMAIRGLSGWLAVAVITVVDLILVATLWRIPIATRISVAGAFVALALFVVLSAATSYIAVYRFLSP